MLAIVLALFSLDAAALPVFARQTGQNCLACHAGGQFPELTPYGRMFKMTGYTIGERTSVPLSVMGIFSYAKVASTNDTGNGAANDPQQTYAKNGAPIFATGSLFIAGKVTDNIGAFAQVTYDNYNGQAADTPTTNTGRWQGHSASDNMDFRYADRFISANNDLIVGVSLNNNPSVSDPWNTAPAWMQYVPDSGFGRSHQFTDANTPYPGFGGYAGSDGLGTRTGSDDLSHSAGLSAYMFWNRTWYAEIGVRRTSNRAFSFMSAGVADADTTHWSTNNPYWRFAYSREWGAHNIMVGTTGMISHIFTDPTDPNSVHRNKDVGIDAQYQYLLDPHTITVQAAYWKNTTDASQTDAQNAINNLGTPLASNSETSYTWRTKASYVYQAKYGGSIAYFNSSGTTDITGTVPFGGTNGLTYEVFWLPVQYARVGLQYTAYNRFQGATSQYDGVRNPRDNNTLFGYVWFAY